ncbi:MAG: DnaA/Hda family protein [Pseudomonadota bacterium]
MAEQLIFPLALKPAMGREDFFVSSANQIAVSMVEAWSNWPLGKLVLEGAEGAGKTHLASTWAHSVKADMVAATDLTRAQVGDFDPKPLVVEDIDRICGLSEPEVALFHVHNILQDAGVPLLLTTRTAPARLSYNLADLQSRIEAASLVKIEALDDALLGAILVKLLSDRQLHVSPNVLRYAVPRLPRNFAAAQQFVEAVDNRALSTGKAISLGIVRDVIARDLDKSPGDDA